MTDLVHSMAYIPFHFYKNYTTEWDSVSFALRLDGATARPACLNLLDLQRDQHRMHAFRFLSIQW